MKYRRVLYLILGLIFLGAGFEGKIPDFQSKNLQQQTVYYHELKGEKVTVIDFWATWCKPCRSAIPRLVELYQQFREQGVQFLAVNVDGPRNLSKVKPMARALGIPYPVLLDINGEIMKELKVTAIPTLLVVDSKDRVVFFHQGYRPGDEKIIEKELRKLLQSSRKGNDED